MTPLKRYALSLTYNIPDEDKDKAEKAIMGFEFLLKKLTICDEHIDLIYIPFKDNPNITPEQAYKVRAALRRYRDRVADNFNTFKRMAFRCFILLQPFASDTQVVKLTKSFIMSIGDIEKQVNRFIELFSNIEAKDFAQTVVKGAENIKKEIAQLEQIIEDRIINHIQQNILARSWVDTVSDELQEKVEKHTPFSVEMVNKRNEMIGNDIE